MPILKMLITAALLLGTPAMAGHHKSGEGDKSGKQNRFAKYDANGDGKISRDEFMSMAEKRFEKMDTDKSGSLTKDEMKRPRKQR